MEGLYCDKCGKLMIENNNTMIGMNLSVNSVGLIPFSIGFIRKQLGKYAPKDASRADINVQICWECMLDAFLEVKTKE